jgi:ubiquinone/menaquinone biosynthesis C-methylase UbiE
MEDIKNYTLHLLNSFIFNNCIINTKYTLSELNLFKQKLIENNFYKNIKDFIDNKYKDELIQSQQPELHKCSYRIDNIKKYILNKSKALDPKLFKVDSYLDIGCFGGGITESVGNYFNLSKTRIYGVDIKKYKSEYNFNFNEYNGYELPYDDDSFNLITCLMVLHHIPPDNLEKLMDEIYRVLKKGGVIIVREHSPINNLQEMCLDILHNFYDLVWNVDSDMNWAESSNTYKNSNEWIDVFLNSSFVVDVRPYVYKNINTNPFMSYFCSFKKPE